MAMPGSKTNRTDLFIAMEGDSSTMSRRRFNLPAAAHRRELHTYVHSNLFTQEEIEPIRNLPEESMRLTQDLWSET
jgi:hypothetical protein